MTKKIAQTSILLALALGIAWLERLLPPGSPIPGVRLGLSNTITLIALYLLGLRAAASVTILRVLLAGALFGGVSSIIYGMAGALLSLTIMFFLKISSKPTIIGVSAAGGVFHNVGQLLIASIVVNNFGLFTYLPILAVSGTAAGALTGFLAHLALKRLEKFNFS
jgi:heptaprenyl diphosphate synthase